MKKNNNSGKGQKIFIIGRDLLRKDKEKCIEERKNFEEKIKEIIRIINEQGAEKNLSEEIIDQTFKILINELEQVNTSLSDLERHIKSQEENNNLNYIVYRMKSIYEEMYIRLSELAEDYFNKFLIIDSRDYEVNKKMK